MSTNYGKFNAGMFCDFMKGHHHQRLWLSKKPFNQNENNHQNLIFGYRKKWNHVQMGEFFNNAQWVEISKLL